MHFDNLAGYFNVMPTTEEQIVLPIWVSLKLEIMKDKTLVYKNNFYTLNHNNISLAAFNRIRNLSAISFQQ